MIAYQEGLGKIDMDQIEVKGANLSKENLNFKLPPQTLPKYDGIKLLLGKNCGDCIGPYAIALTRMEKKGLIESLKGYTVLIGKHAKHKDKKSIAIGRCSEDLKGSVSCYVPGCPPTGLLIGDQIKFSLGLEKEPSIYLKIWRKYIEEIESSRHPS